MWYVHALVGAVTLFGGPFRSFSISFGSFIRVGHFFPLSPTSDPPPRKDTEFDVASRLATMLVRSLSLLLLAITCTTALKLSSPAAFATRRRALQYVVAAPLLTVAPLASQAAGGGDQKVGYACRGSDDCGVDAQAIRALTNAPGQGEAAGIRFGGTYSDPLHPDCPRKVVLAGKKAIITGTDTAGGKEWKVKGEPYGKYLIIDFSSKGGPTEVRLHTGTGTSSTDAACMLRLVLPRSNNVCTRACMPHSLQAVAKWTGFGLKFEDGNVWTKK